MKRPDIGPPFTAVNGGPISGHETEPHDLGLSAARRPSTALTRAPGRTYRESRSQAFAAHFIRVALKCANAVSGIVESLQERFPQGRKGQ